MEKKIVLKLMYPNTVKEVASDKKKRLPAVIDALDKDNPRNSFGIGVNEESNVGPLKGDVNIQGDPSSGCAVIDTSTGYSSTHI